LIILEALSNFKGLTQLESKHIAMDNYYASIRAMVYRPEKEKDASSSLGTGGSQTERKEVVQEKT